MGAVMVLEMLLEQVRSVVSAALWDFGLTPPAWQLMSWLWLERTASATRLAELTCRRRQEAQRLLEGLEKRGLVERLPDMTRDRTAAWELTPDGAARVKQVAQRLRHFDALLEREFRDQLPSVMDCVQRMRTVFRRGDLSSTGELYEARLRAVGKLVPPEPWTPVKWDL